MNVKSIKYVFAGAGVISAASVGGYYITSSSTSKTDLKNEIKNEPKITKENKWEPASSKNSNYASGTIGNVYGTNLMNTTSNEGRWKEKFDELIANNELRNSDFNDSTLSYGFSNEQHVNTSLNKKCEEYYKKTPSDIYSSEEEEKNWNIMWNYCSEWNPKMVDKNNEEYNDKSIGKTKSKELLSTKNNDNKDLWESKNKSFFELTSAPEEEIFKKLYETKNQNGSSNLRDTCEETYKKIIENNDQTEANEAIKYCSLKTIN